MVGKLVNAFRGTRGVKDTSTVAPIEPEPRNLPADLESAIRGCSILERTPGADDEPRIIIQLANRGGGWVHSAKASRDAIAARWPTLSEKQMVRALRFLDNEIAMHLRGSPPRRKRASWVTSWRDGDFHA